jgi:hypothetical protein
MTDALAIYLSGMFFGACASGVITYIVMRRRCRNGEIGMPDWAKKTMREIKDNLK